MEGGGETNKQLRSRQLSFCGRTGPTCISYFSCVENLFLLTLCVVGSYCCTSFSPSSSSSICSSSSAFSSSSSPSSFLLFFLLFFWGFCCDVFILALGGFDFDCGCWS